MHIEGGRAERSGVERGGSPLMWFSRSCFTAKYPDGVDVGVGVDHFFYGK